MKTTYLILAALLVTVAACSEQENTETASQAPIAEMPAMEQPIEAKPTAMLPNEINASDMSGDNVEQDASGKKVLYWYDPMLPDRHFSKSGLSPFMDMKLAPKYAE
jgi:uncharacterized protein YcfL